MGGNKWCKVVLIVWKEMLGRGRSKKKKKKFKFCKCVLFIKGVSSMYRVRYEVYRNTFFTFIVFNRFSQWIQNSKVWAMASILLKTYFVPHVTKKITKLHVYFI